MNYKNIDLKQDATKGYADIASYMEELGNLANSMKSQQILKLLNHQVILSGLDKIAGLNDEFDQKVSFLLKSVNNTLEKKKTPFLKIFSLHILFFMILFFITIFFSAQNASVGYAISSIGMGIATGVLNLMLLRERKKYAINNLFFLLEEELIENYFTLHKNIATTIEHSKNENRLEELETTLKTMIEEFLKLQEKEKKTREEEY